MNCGVARTWPSGKSVTRGVYGADGALGEQTGRSSPCLLVVLKPVIRDAFPKRLIQDSREADGNSSIIWLGGLGDTKKMQMVEMDLMHVDEVNS